MNISTLFKLPKKALKIVIGYEMCDWCNRIVPKWETVKGNDDEYWKSHSDNCGLKSFARAFRNLDYEYGLRKEKVNW